MAVDFLGGSGSVLGPRCEGPGRVPCPHGLRRVPWRDQGSAVLSHQADIPPVPALGVRCFFPVPPLPPAHCIK